jgi:hypothetical protein
LAKIFSYNQLKNGAGVEINFAGRPIDREAH